MKTIGYQLQEMVDVNLSRTCGSYLTKRTPNEFTRRVLAFFDHQMDHRIRDEVKVLSGGETGIADSNLPVSFQRTVIREALSDLRILDLVQTLTDFSAGATTMIPYETRDIAAILNDGIVYEGNAIPRASIGQASEMAYLLPMKVAFVITNEVMHFSQASALNWDAYARNVESNARVIRECVARRICNELQRSSDAYQATDIAGEAFDTQLDGSTSIIKTVHFPIVRPFQVYDLKGTAINAPENPITMVLNSTTLDAFDGSGNQAPGSYYRVINYNLGYIQIVDETGTPLTPADTGTNTIGYSYSTNVVKVDTDLGTATTGERMNDIIRAVGSRKAMMSTDRFINPDFLLMSPVMNDQATNADMFAASLKRNGTDTTSQGDLEAIKSTPAWSTNAPGVDLGDERIIMGLRNTLTYTIAKPFVTGAPFEAVDSNGRAIGKKQAYGEEYSTIKVPAAIRGRLTSVLAYSFTGR